MNKKFQVIHFSDFLGQKVCLLGQIAFTNFFFELSDSNFDENEKTREEILLEHHKKIRKPGIQYLDFNRMLISPLRPLMRIYKDPKMELTKTLDVNFSGEEGADMGGRGVLSHCFVLFEQSR